MSNSGGDIEVAIGPSGSESAFTRRPFSMSSSELFTDGGEIFWGYIPVGSRIAIRKTTSLSTLDYHVFGIPYS